MIEDCVVQKSIIYEENAVHMIRKSYMKLRSKTHTDLTFKRGNIPRKRK